MVPEVRRGGRAAGREAPCRRIWRCRLGRRLHRIQIRVGLPAAALAAAELAALAGAADGDRCGGLPRRHERGGDL